MATIAELAKFGQSIWLDFIDRNLLAKGGLKRLVDAGVTGVTTNPTIFHKAITASADYDASIVSEINANPSIDEYALFEALTAADVQSAADIMRPVFDRTAGADGYVSIEVAPDLAFDAQGTIKSARHLWKRVARPNVMIKVPGTAEGVKAIEQLIADGINVNVTLLFSVKRYEEVVRAWALGLSRCATPREVASVASFFVSRVDGKTDKLLDGIQGAASLLGKIAIGNAKLAYAKFEELMKDPVIAEQLARGARPQRPLWASTSSKNPKYSDVLYVESLIGRDTVNTLPPDTLAAFQDHGVAADTVTSGMANVQSEMSLLKQHGIDLEGITRALETEGVASFKDSYDKLLHDLKQKRLVMAKGLAA
ncbi:MAG: transaldolase [Betaproteobacteria bacterium]|nr:transaldolase [Betaproteobacteria bacterium]